MLVRLIKKEGDLFRGSVNLNSTEIGSNLGKTVPYQNLFQNLPVPAVVLNLRNEFVICNDEFEHFTKFRLNEIIGRDLMEILIPAEALEPAKFLFGKLLLGEKVRDRQLIKLNDGSMVEVEINGTPILQKEEQVGLLVLITRLLPYENQFLNDFEKLKRLTEISQLIGAIGHELRNPLCIIKNSAYLVERQLFRGEGAAGRKYLTIIRREAEMGNKIIANLLHFVRKREPQRQWIDPIRPIKEVLIRYPLPDNIVLDLNSNSQGTKIFADPDHLEIVFLNLITNAVTAMTNGGKLTIELKTDANRLVYHITDTGCGIAKEDLKNIFQPFFTTRRNGIGLGLAITKQLVEANQGKISVVSEKGVGTSFAIEFSNLQSYE